MLKKILLIGILVVAGIFLLMQLVPYGRNHTNPPVVSEPNWDSPETLALAERACFDCHSNETVWPWYSNIAPISWLVYHDTAEGRETLNFSEWGTRGEGEEGGEMAEQIQEGEMPMPIYLLTHTDARLTDAEKTALANGLYATGGSSETKESREGDDDD